MANVGCLLKFQVNKMSTWKIKGKRKIKKKQFSVWFTSIKTVDLKFCVTSHTHWLRVKWSTDLTVCEDHIWFGSREFVYVCVLQWLKSFKFGKFFGKLFSISLQKRKKQSQQKLLQGENETRLDTKDTIKWLSVPTNNYMEMLLQMSRELTKTNKK